MKVALANGVLGEKLMVDSVYNCLVNDQGEKTSPPSVSVTALTDFGNCSEALRLHPILHFLIKKKKKSVTF